MDTDRYKLNLATQAELRKCMTRLLAHILPKYLNANTLKTTYYCMVCGYKSEVNPLELPHTNACTIGRALQDGREMMGYLTRQIAAAQAAHRHEIQARTNAKGTEEPGEPRTTG